MGLILGSLIRGGFYPSCKQVLPCFSFIVSKLKFDESGQYLVDESGLAKITQEEIDEKIKSLIAEAPDDMSKKLWGTVGVFLTVDPNKRPTACETFITCSNK